MVVAKVVRIRNHTQRRFQVRSADLFSTLRLDGQVCTDGAIEVPPSCDQAIEGLAIPWETSLSSRGFQILEPDTNETLRCLVGPRECDGENRDWLQFRSSDWEPLAQEKWIPLGRRHFLGAVGGAAELVLTFRGKESLLGIWYYEEEKHFIISQSWKGYLWFEGFGLVGQLDGGGHGKLTLPNGGAPRGNVLIRRVQDGLELLFRPAGASAWNTPICVSDTVAEARLSDVVNFEFWDRLAPKNTVFLNVFDLASSLAVPNALLCNDSFSSVGAFHAAVEVYGEEWSFYRTPNPNWPGVCKSTKPRNHPVHVYRQSVSLGQTNLQDWEVRYLVYNMLSPKWPGGGYDLLHRNCIHFCEELQRSLGVQSVPGWVRGLHETGASILRVPWPLSLFIGEDDYTVKTRALLDGDADEPAVGLGDASSSDSISKAAVVNTSGSQSTDSTSHSASARMLPAKPDPLDRGRSFSLSASEGGSFISSAQDVELQSGLTKASSSAASSSGAPAAPAG